jgi:hypothetical protein
LHQQAQAKVSVLVKPEGEVQASALGVLVSALGVLASVEDAGYNRIVGRGLH